jgi:hypothetical protein
MAIAFDTAVNQSVASGTNTLAMTIGAGANYLIVFALVLSGTTTATWNGVAMTQSGTTATTVASGFKLYAYYLAAPATGTHNIVVTQSGATTLYIMGLSYSGVAQTAPEASAGFNPAGAATSLTQTVTSLTDNAWGVCFGVNDQGSYAAGTGSTLRGTVMDAAVAAFDTNGPKTPAGTISMTQTGGNSSNLGGIIFAIAPSGIVASTPHLLGLIGVGV